MQQIFQNTTSLYTQIKYPRDHTSWWHHQRLKPHLRRVPNLNWQIFSTVTLG